MRRRNVQILKNLLPLYLNRVSEASVHWGPYADTENLAIFETLFSGASALARQLSSIAKEIW